MTISSSTNRVQFTGNGVTTSFSYPYVFFAQSDLLVTLFNTTTNAAVTPAPVLGGSATYDYTVSGTFDSATGEYLSGANVVFVTAPPSTYRVTIEGVIPQTQAVTLIDNSKFPAATVNGALDRLTRLVQRTAQLVGQAVSFPSSDPTTLTNVLPAAGTRAGKYLAFDSDGNPTATSGTTSTIAASTFWEGVLTRATAALSRTDLAAAGTGDNNAFTGTNTVLTATAGTNTTQIASTAFVRAASAKVYQQIITSTQSYTPTAGMLTCLVECVGGGGGGGGITGDVGWYSEAAGGGAGGYSRKITNSATVGAGVLVTIGAGGAGGTAGDNNGTAGGDTSFGAICIAKGGSAGQFSNAGTQVGVGGAGGVAGTGDFTPTGSPGKSGQVGLTTAITARGADGGSSIYGGGGRGPVVTTATATAGGAATNYGAGGGGAAALNSAGTAAGGAGTSGVVIITEFCDR